MKFLIVGLGSMGKRRIRNIKHLDAGQIIGVEPNEERRRLVEEEYKIKTVSSVEEGLKENPDAFIISTPPDKHGSIALIAAQHGKHFFVEASVILEDEILKANDISKKKNIVAMPSCTMRFNLMIKRIKTLVDSGKTGKVMAIDYHMGQWLPDWHPWEDISKFYVGKKETGAGREMIPFELEWIQWIFGDIERLSCIKGKFSNLPVDIDDIYSINLRFSKGLVGNILIDVVSRNPVRRMEVIGDKGTIIMDWNEKKIRIFDADSKKWENFIEEEKHEQKGYWAKDDMYIEEMRHFINVILGKEILIYNMDEDIRNLKTLLTAEKSSDDGKHISM